MNSFLKFEIYYVFHHLLLYCDMSNEIIQSIAYDSYDDFQHLSTSYFHKISFPCLIFLHTENFSMSFILLP
jgi:hypothetical protein